MGNFQIRRCDPTELQAAFRCLHESLSPDQQVSLVQTLDMLRDDPSAFETVLIAKADGRIIAAAWVQFTPGNAATVWPPAFASPAASELLQAIERLLDQNGTALAQILIAATEPVDEALLESGGFHRLVDLAYYTLERSSFPAKFERGRLTFVPRATDFEESLGQVIEQSYIGTQDCPELNNLRKPAEVIEGYKAQGTFDADDWFLVQIEGRNVGVLILASHPPGENCELVYMGIVPEARGKGLGEQIVRFAVEQTRLKGSQRLVLAVDERNKPALEVYRRLGFVLWERRTVYARLCKS